MTQLGTVGWTSPEIFNGSHYTVLYFVSFIRRRECTHKKWFCLLNLQEKADIFGFAVLLWELIYCQKPWKGVHTMKVIHMVVAGKRLSLSNPPVGTPAIVSHLPFFIFLYIIFFVLFLIF
jgi:hypothetical protein